MLEENYLDKIIEYAFLLKKEYAKNKREREEIKKNNCLDEPKHGTISRRTKCEYLCKRAFGRQQTTQRRKISGEIHH